jgi:hypothetical protein
VAITTLDGAIAGFQPPQSFSKAVTGTLTAGLPTTLWALAGYPGAGAYDTTLNGVTLSSTSALVAGQLPHYDPAGGINSYLARFQGVATQAGVLVLCDRLWHNGGYTITSTGTQSSTTPTWPSRDNTGTANGAGVMLGVELSGGTGAGTPTITASYTNSGGFSGRTGTNVLATKASAATGSFYELGLQAGDVGVKALASITLSGTWTSGTMNVVAYRVLARLELPGALIPNAIDLLTAGMPQIFNGTVPYMYFIPNTTTTSNVSGQYIETQG